jgi:hypothetical protein
MSNLSMDIYSSIGCFLSKQDYISLKLTCSNLYYSTTNDIIRLNYLMINNKEIIEFMICSTLYAVCPIWDDFPFTPIKYYKSTSLSNHPFHYLTRFDMEWIKLSTNKAVKASKIPEIINQVKIWEGIQIPNDDDLYV